MKRALLVAVAMTLVACVFDSRASTPPRPDGPFPTFRTARHAAGDYLSPLEAVLETAQPGWVTRSRIGWEWSKVGAYDRIEDSGEQPPYLVETSEAALMAAIHPVPALPAICSAAHGRRLVMIDEEHPFPVDRAFGAEILPCLRADGFDALAVEMLPDDVSPVRADGIPRDYPLNFGDEPRMSDLISSAVALGFQLVPYEHVVPATVTGPQRRTDEREQGEADRLAGWLRDHPDRRVVVWCGYAHLYERAYYGARWMAARVREQTGIDPLTIVQIAGRVREQDAGPLFIAINHHRNLPGPLLVDLAGAWDRMPSPFREDLASSEPGAPPVADLVVVHESRRAGDARHLWLEEPPEQAHPTRVACHARRHPLGLLVQVFRDRDAAGRDVPYDQALCPCNAGCELVAPPGRWYVVVRDERTPLLSAFTTLGPEPLVLRPPRD